MLEIESKVKINCVFFNTFYVLKPLDRINISSSILFVFIQGAEDDDMEVRLSKEKIGFERLNINIARYRMLWHKKRFKNPNRVKLLMNARYSNIYSTDGINNVKYNVSRLTQYKLFTHLEINVGEPPMYIQQLLYPDRFTTHTSHVSAVTVEMTSNQQNAEQSLN